MQIGATILTVIIFITSLIGNVTVLYIVCARSNMRNSTNILIANMAVADLLVTLNLPYILKWLYVLDDWFGTIIGKVLCYFCHAAPAISIAASVFTLVAISFDRSFHILFPLKRIFTSKVIKAVIVITWLGAVGLCVPLFIITKHWYYPPLERYLCSEDSAKYYELNKKFQIVFITLTWIVPLLLIATVYSMVAITLWTRELPGHQSLTAQKKANASGRKATIMLVTVVVVFGLCWAPQQIRNLLIAFAKDPRTVQLPAEIRIYMPFIGYANSAINPILYVIFSENFRREFARVLFFWQSSEQRYSGLTRGNPTISRRLSSLTTTTRRFSSLMRENIPLKSMRKQSKETNESSELRKSTE